MAQFTHLHVHTEMSLLDGLGKIDDYLSLAEKLGMTSLAITDHGNMYAALDFYLAAKKKNIRPIIGCEAYVAPAGMKAREKENNHLVLLAKNETGYRNLIYLTTMASLEGFYYRPRIDLELLAEHHEGLIGLSACLQGAVAHHLRSGRVDYAEQAACRLRDIFGPGNFYLEIMDHGLPEQKAVNPQMIELAHKLNLPLVATNDVHYARRDDAYAQEVLVCIQTGSTMDDPKRMRMESQDFYLRPPEEMAELFSYVPEAIENTQVIAEQCNLELSFGQFYLPHFPVPEGHTPATYLEDLCWKGLRERYSQITPDLEERLNYELSVIKQMDFPSYFLVVQDFVGYAKRSGIPVGPGRGSAAGSIVAYCLDITSVDPIQHGLIFERFLNPSRISMPDIDLDFADDRRDEVIRYVTDKYGADHVAQIITFGTMAARAALRDAGRALAMSFGDVDKVAKLVPAGPGVTLGGALESVPELKALREESQDIANLIDTALRLEGVARHASTHAAGVVISRDPLVQHVPLQRVGKDNEGGTVTQYHMGDLEKIGLLKMDFLGLSTLTVLRMAVDLVKQHRGIDLDLAKLPLDDPAIYEILCRGDTSGIFQLEGSMTKRMTMDVKPACFDDVAALMALIRPGPMTMAPLYIQRKDGVDPITYEHPDLEPILGETYGVALYQEQVMRIANVLAGYSMAEGDQLRKAMGKKLPEEMKKHRTRFVSGAKEHGVPEKKAEEIFDMIERFAGYGFNKAHSAAYAVIACQTAYLKAKYPVEYFAALLTSESANADKVGLYISEARRSGIEVLSPNVNHSFHSFTVEPKQVRNGMEFSIRFGLAAVKNVGQGMVEAIIEARDKLPGKVFQSVEQMCEEVDSRQINRRAVESLVKCGAMDDFGSRGSLLASLDRVLGLGQKTQRAREQGQATIFGLFEEPIQTVPVALPDVPEPSRKDLLGWEKEVLGLYVSEHPLEHVMRHLNGQYPTISEITAEMAGQKITLVGLVVSIRTTITKKKESMAVASIEDLSGAVELVVFPKSYERYRELLEEDAILQIEAKVDSRNETAQLICESLQVCQVTEPEPGANGAGSRPSCCLRLQLPATDDADHDIQRMQDLESLLKRFPGNDRVLLRVVQGSKAVWLEAGGGAQACQALESELRVVLGPERVNLETLAVPDQAPASMGK